MLKSIWTEYHTALEPSSEMQQNGCNMLLSLWLRIIILHLLCCWIIIRQIRALLSWAYLMIQWLSHGHTSINIFNAHKDAITSPLYDPYWDKSPIEQESGSGVNNPESFEIVLGELLLAMLCPSIHGKAHVTPGVLLWADYHSFRWSRLQVKLVSWIYFGCSDMLLTCNESGPFNIYLPLEST